jgi:hypothetical protein
MSVLFPACTLSPGYNRRAFLRLGGATVAGLSLPGLLQSVAQATQGKGSVTGKSVIFLFMQGGPPQFETFDPKTDIPAEQATVGGVTATSIPGVNFGSGLPRLAKLAHRLAIVRNFQTGTQHGGTQPISGPDTKNTSIGAIYARVAGPNNPTTGLPTAANLWPIAVDPEQPGPRDRFGRFDTTGFLSSAYAPMTPGAAGPFMENLRLHLKPEELDERRLLLAKIDSLRKQNDGQEGIDGLRQQAVEMLLKGVSKAFDLSQEDKKTVARYDTSHLYNPDGYQKKNNTPSYAAHQKTLGKLLVLARRLCEAGCGFVTVNTEFVWDFHADGNNLGVQPGMKVVGEPFDHAVSAFIEDLEARGLSEKILLVCCGEMGRTPKINKNGGRDHWPSLAPLMLHGGGLTRGQVVGASTRDGGQPVGKPNKPINLLATIFRTLFDFGQVRLLPNLPRDILQLMDLADKTPGVV